jgi:hypothetical protein
LGKGEGSKFWPDNHDRLYDFFVPLPPTEWLGSFGGTSVCGLATSKAGRQASGGGEPVKEALAADPAAVAAEAEVSQ